MKTRQIKLIFWWIVLIVVIALLFLFLTRNKTVPRAIQSSTQSASTVTNDSPNTPNVTPQNAISATSAKSPIANGTGVAEVVEKFVKSKNAPIHFYGQFIDQDSNSVPGVKMNIVIQQLTAPNPALMELGSKYIRLERTTDGDGRLEIQGETGDGISLESIQKTGYDLSPKTPNHFGPSSGSFENPVILRMWKKGASAQLISQDKDTRIPYDGTPVVFDLLTGQQNLGDAGTGDLRISLTRDPLDIPSGYRKAFEWHATIEAIGGGLIQSDDEFMYSAPEEGYQPRIQIDMPADATNWANIYDISFFAKTRDGHVYSHVKLEFRVDSTKPQTGFTITSTANPDGSRNLQP